LLLALAARGESRIYSSEIIARGYENIEKKLRSLGAEIRIDD
jgi:UDP-N-acetylglucosamine enolpyruvyl transferase